MMKFLNVLDSINEITDEDLPKYTVRYLERFLELLIDLEALLPTRRFFNTVLDDSHLIVRCQLSKFIHCKDGKLFSQVSD